MKKGKFIIESFESLTDYVNVIGGRNLNSVFANEVPCSMNGSDSFTGTKTYNDSLILISNGYKEGLDNINEQIGKRINYQGVSSKNIPQASVVGYAPHVPNAIAGIPQSMMSTRKIQIKTKVISILYDISASAKMSTKQMAIAGSNLLELIMMLEIQGYRVELKIATSFCVRGQYCLSIVKVKSDKQPINPLKISYPLIHASFFRRQGFKWVETCPEITAKSLSDGYGYPLRSVLIRYAHNIESTSDIRRYLKENTIVEENCFYTNFYEASDNTAEKLIKEMGITKK